MGEKNSRFSYLRGNGEFIPETPQQRMLRMLSVQHPPQESSIPEAEFSANQLRQLLNGREQKI